GGSSAGAVAVERHSGDARQGCRRRARAPSRALLDGLSAAAGQLPTPRFTRPPPPQRRPRRAGSAPPCLSPLRTNAGDAGVLGPATAQATGAKSEAGGGRGRAGGRVGPRKLSKPRRRSVARGYGPRSQGGREWSAERLP